MNNFREVNSQGSVPQDMLLQRSIFDRSNTLKTTFNAGKLIPCYLDEVYAGDTIQIDPHFVLRGQTPLTPVMDNANLDIYFFFVPNRIIWTPEYNANTGAMTKGGWKEFMGENNFSVKGNAWSDVHTQSIPKIAVPVGGWQEGSVADYLGLPVNQNNTISGTHPVRSLNALPFRAYCEVWNQYFRDQNYQDPCHYVRGSSEVIGVRNQQTNSLPNENYITNAALGGDLCPVNKYKDYFTSVLPSPLKHSPIMAGVKLNNLPVSTLVGEHQMGSTGILFRETANQQAPYLLKRDAGTSNAQLRDARDPVGTMEYPTNLWAILDDADQPKIDVQGLRDAWAMVKIYERDARHGTRYNELLKAHYGVASPDIELDRPEYLGGNRTPININQVLQTTQGTGQNATLGATGAMSYTSSDAINNNGGFIKSFTEHGYVIGVMCVRTEHTYSQGENRLWHRNERTSFYTPELAHISEQPVYTRELYADFTDANPLKPTVWGFQEAWAELRYKPNQLGGMFRQWKNAQGANETNLSMWHYGDNYETTPSMSSEWVQETTTNIDRTTVLGSRTDKVHQYMIDMYFKANYTRVLPTYSVPSLVDHI